MKDILGFGPDTLLIKQEIYIPDKYGVRYHNGDKIICTIIKETDQAFMIEAHQRGTDNDIQVSVPRADVVAYRKRGFKDWVCLKEEAK